VLAASPKPLNRNVLQRFFPPLLIFSTGRFRAWKRHCSPKKLVRNAGGRPTLGHAERFGAIGRLITPRPSRCCHPAGQSTGGHRAPAASPGLVRPSAAGADRTSRSGRRSGSCSSPASWVCRCYTRERRSDGGGSPC